MTRSSNRGPRRFPASELCRCDGDLLDEDVPEADLEEDPCPACGGRVMRCPPPVWMVEEEDDC